MNLPPTVWRLLLTPPAQGTWNMAVDEAILEFSRRVEQPTTLRLYAWTPPCLSLGYGQSYTDIDLDRLKSYDWDVVRRPTGGRAILHTDELTYAVIGSQEDPLLTGGVLESYQRLSNALLEALKRMEITADAVAKNVAITENMMDNPVCFEVPSNYEITFKGKKLIGSAQARRKNTVLQHGSLPLSGDLTRIVQVLRYPNDSSRTEAAERLLSHATTVESVLGFRGDWWIASQAMISAFSSILGLKLIPGGLTPSEGRRALELYEQKYNHPSWTEKS
jgi:lipoate-protein ligase A